MSETAREGVPFVIAAPSGTGKTTVCRALVERDARLVFSVSHTTRAPRSGERDGRDYHFVSPECFAEMAAAGEFLEHAEYSGNRYGTAWASLDATRRQGLDVLLEIEIDGAAQVRQRGVGAFFVFLLPPSLEALERRLRGRGTDGEHEIERRLAIAEREFRAARDFDAVVINDRVDAAVQAVADIVDAVRRGEREEVTRRCSLERVEGALPAPLGAWVRA